MAHMIPTDGGHFDPSSKEREMFNALSSLSDDYYVFHSYRLVQLIPDKGLNENEIDFLVFNPNYGSLFLECKNRTLRKNNEKWEFRIIKNGIEQWKTMEQDPFTQAFSGQHNLFNKFKELYKDDKTLLDIINKCKFMVGIWLPKYSRADIDNDTIGLGTATTKEIILTSDELNDSTKLKSRIELLMERMNKVHLVCHYQEEIIDAASYSHKASYYESMKFLKEVLTPTFRTIINVRKDYEDTYLELLDEQFVVLDFLAHQRTAAISGASGTGKTLVAVERARRLSNNGKKVLFICFNKNLVSWLKKSYKSELINVDFYTLASYGCKKCQCSLDKLSYHDLKEILEYEILEGSFEYEHIIVDEGQDFGKDNIDETGILDLFAEYGSMDSIDSSFFIFYDKNQLVNSKKLPTYLQNVDSKLTLYKNCRNTKNIANTAYSLLNTNPIVYEKAWNGDIVSFILYDNAEELEKRLGNIIEDLADETVSDRVIITCGESANYSEISENLIADSNRNYIYKSKTGKKTRFFTSATFKGLEADDVIIVDVTDKTFNEDNKSFYVAASRAKKRLFVFMNRNKLDFENIINTRFKDAFPLKDKSKQLVTAMHGMIK